MTMVSAETKAYREEAIAWYDDSIVSAQSYLASDPDNEGRLAMLERLKELRVWAETCEPVKYITLEEGRARLEKALEADPTNAELLSGMEMQERLEAVAVSPPVPY
jgi:hypothetical protein